MKIEIGDIIYYEDYKDSNYKFKHIELIIESFSLININYGKLKKFTFASPNKEYSFMDETSTLHNNILKNYKKYGNIIAKEHKIRNIIIKEILE